MRPAGSERHEPPARPDERVEQQPAFTQSPGSPEITGFHFGTVMEAIPGFIWSALPDGRVEFCNQRWLDYTGLALDQVRGGGLAEAIHPLDQSDFQRSEERRVGKECSALRSR